MSLLSPVEKTPPPPRVRVIEDPFRRALNYAMRIAWGWRLELVIASLLWWLWSLLVAAMAVPLALLVLAGVVAVMLVPSRPRKTLVGSLSRGSLRRRWARASRHCGLETFNHRIPRIVGVERIPSGERLRVRMPAGLCPGDLEHEADPLASVLGARELRVTRDEANARYATVVLARRDPLDLDQPLPWPHEHAARLCLWEPIPIGIDEDGEPVTVSMIERNLLLGGEPGAGKSAAASMIVATAALDPEVRLWLVDGKLVELSMWRDCADRTIGFDLDQATAALGELRAEMTRRYELLLTAGKRKVARDLGWPLYLVVVDELAFFTFGTDGRPNKEFNSTLRDLVSRGRAAGIIVVAATQKPSGDVVPTALRDLFGFRWALRCATPQASDTILGSGWATNGYSAVVDARRRGLGYLLAEGGLPVRVQSFYLDDDAILAIAARAALLRAAHAELRRDTGEGPGLAVVA